MTWTGLDPLGFQRDGFVHVRGVLGEDEVARLRTACDRERVRARDAGQLIEPVAGEDAPVGDLLGREAPLGDLVFDERIVRIARTLLGRDDLVYFGDSHMMLGGHGRGFHKDNTNRDDPTHPDWQSPYTLLRMGIYLEDHSRHSGGLKLRRGSHLRVDVTSGEIVDVPTVPGDVVVWSLRTTHSGHAIRVKGAPWLHLQPRFEIRLPKRMRVGEERERIAIFITWGVDDEHLQRYLEKHTNLETYPDNYMYKSWLYCCKDARYDELARARNVKIVRPIAEYGKFYGSNEKRPGAHLSRSKGGSDNYRPQGSEAVIRAIGKVARKLTGDSTREAS